MTPIIGGEREGGGGGGGGNREEQQIQTIYINNRNNNNSNTFNPSTINHIFLSYLTVFSLIVVPVIFLCHYPYLFYQYVLF